MKFFEKKFPDMSAQQQEFMPEKELAVFYRKQIACQEGWQAAFETIRAKFNVMGIDQIISFIDRELETGEQS